MSLLFFLVLYLYLYDLQSDYCQVSDWLEQIIQDLGTRLLQKT